MSIVHFSTEVTGGAGAYAVSIHKTVLSLGMTSVLATRDSTEIEGAITVKPMTKWDRFFLARRRTLLEALGVIDSKYATFGIEKSSVSADDIQRALATKQPRAFVFYWVSRFITFQCMHELRQAYPRIPFALICLDEGYLGGGCHYSWGCHGYEGACSNCPSTSSPIIKRRIARELRARETLLPHINPIVIYPTTNILRMGRQSTILRTLRSVTIPLGAISDSEGALHQGVQEPMAASEQPKRRRLVLLIRSSREYRKGCDLFVDALQLLHEMLPNLRNLMEVVTIGDAMLKTNEIDHFVHHTHMGVVPRSELMAIYRRVDALLVTSREDTGPIMINECVALGRFVISTPVGVANDLITSAKVGILLDDFTSSALALGIKRFIELNQRTSTELTDDRVAQKMNPQLTFEGFTEQLLSTLGVECS